MCWHKPLLINFEIFCSKYLSLNFGLSAHTIFGFPINTNEMLEYPEDEYNSTMIKIKLDTKLRTQLIRNQKIGRAKRCKCRRAKSPRPRKLERSECRERKNGAGERTNLEPIQIQIALRTPSTLLKIRKRTMDNQFPIDNFYH